MADCHADGAAGEPGRDLDEAAQEARHATLAAALAEALDVDATTVQEALDGFQEYRQAERAAELPDGVEPGSGQGQGPRR